MASLLQENFAGGEVAPSFYGRIDLDRYSSSARSIKNFVITQHGALKKRPGMTYQYDLPAFVRLFRFDHSAGSWLGYLKAGSDIIVNEEMIDLPFSYSAEDLPKIQFVQVGDILSIVCPGKQIVEVLNDEGVFSSRLRPGVKKDPYFPVQIPIQWTIRFQENNGYRPVGDNWLGWEDDDHPAREWDHRLTLIYSDDIQGEVEGYDGVTHTSIQSYYVDWYSKYSIIIAASLPVNVIGVRLYRGRNGVYAFVGEARKTQDVLLYNLNGQVDGTYAAYVIEDEGSIPDVSVQPPEPLEDNPDIFTEPSSYPETLGFFEQRAVIGGTHSKPRTIYFSRSGELYEFMKNGSFTPLDSDAMAFNFASTEHERIQNMVQMNGRLIVLTDKNLWEVAGLNGPLTPSSGAATQYSGVGSSRLAPIVIRNTCIFVSASGNQIFEIRGDQQGTAWATRDLTAIARHLFEGHSIVSWSYQATPDPIVWLVRDDGVLISMAYSYETDLCAFSHHETTGTVLGVCCIGTDVFVCVRRGDSHFVECMDFIGPARYLDGAREVESPAVAVTLGRQAWRKTLVISSLPSGAKQAIERPGQLGLSSPQPCIAGDAFSAEIQLMDVPIDEGMGLRQKTLRKICVDCISSSSLRLGESVSAQFTPETLDNSAERRLLAANLTHGYGLEALGVIRSEQPVPVTVLGCSREVDFGDV